VKHRPVEIAAPFRLECHNSRLSDYCFRPNKDIEKKEVPNPIEPAQETGETNAVEYKSCRNLISGDFVEFIKDEEGKLSCKKALALESISAIAARNIAEGEMLTFDMNGDTEDLTTPQKATSRQ